MLDSRGDDMFPAVGAHQADPLDGQVVRLGSPGGGGDLSGLGPMARPMSSLAFSTAFLASTPWGCRLEALPNPPFRKGSTASRTSGRTGVVAA